MPPPCSYITPFLPLPCAKRRGGGKGEGSAKLPLPALRSLEGREPDSNPPLIFVRQNKPLVNEEIPYAID